MTSKVKITVDGIDHLGWTQVNIRRSIYTISGNFELGFSPLWDQVPKDFKLYAGESCKVSIGSSTVITGFIDSIKRKYDSSNYSIQVSGRDLTADLVDCNSLREARTWENAKFETIIDNLLKPFKIPYLIKADTGARFPAWSIQDETVFDNLAKAASLRELILLSDGLGTLIVTKPHSNRAQFQINDKSNVLSASSCDDYQNRFRYYRTQAHNFGATEHNEALLKIVARSNDEEIKRYRPLLLTQDGEIREKIAQSRLDWENKIRIAKSHRVELTLTGWKASKDTLWNINQRVSLDLPSIQVKGTYLTTEVCYSMDQNGMKTTLHLEGLHSSDVDPTLQDREYNLKKLVEQDQQSNGGN